MPDFDKDLNPILTNTKNEVPILDNPATPVPRDYGALGGFADLRNGMAENPIFGKRPVVSELLPTVSAGELYGNRRYATYDANIVDIEDQKAYAQSWWDKAANGVLKGLNLTATTIAGGFGMLYGAAKSPFTGRLADIWDNEVMRGLDEWNNEVDQTYLPNYYTNVERDAAWYSTDNWFRANFLFDKLIKNSGFAVGAMLSGNIANAGLLRAGSALGKLAAAGAGAAEISQAFKLFTPLLRNTARAFSAGKNVEAAAVLEKELSSIADVTARSSKLAEIAKTTNKFADFGQTARRTAIAAYSSAGEASFEALQTAKEYRENLIEEYKSNNLGQEPSGIELEKINQLAENVGKTSFFGNLAILGVTEYAQLPKLLGSSYAAERQAANSFVREAGDVVKREGKYVAAAPTTKFGKIYSKVGGAAKYIIDLKESLQEGAQYALQVGTQNYFNKVYQSKAVDVWTDGFLHGFVGVDEKGEGVGAFNSKEGAEGMLLGAITGGLMQTRGTIAQKKALKSNTEAFIDGLNKAPTFRDAFKERLAAANRGVVLQEQQQEAILQGDKLEAKDLDADMMHNYLVPRIKYGRLDMLLEDVGELQQLGMTNEGLASLKQQGLANINDTIDSYQKRLSSFITTAKNTAEIYKSFDLRFSGEVLKDDKGNPVLDSDGRQQRKYSPLVIDKMVYAASKVADYDVRIPQVNSSLVKAGINTQDVIDSIIKDGKPNKEATAKALNDINNLDVLDTVKDELKSDLSDVIELSLRRKMFIEEHNDIKNKPLNYDILPGYGFGIDEKDKTPVDVVQKEIDAEDKRKETTKKLEIGKEYSLKEALTKEGSQLQLAPKITVLSQTLGGELEVKLPNGKTTFLSPEQFKKYNISDENNTSQEMADVLDKAIDTVLKEDKYAEVKKEMPKVEEGQKLDKVGWVNSLDNQDLIDDIEKEFDKQTRAAFEEKERVRKEVEKLKRNKEELNKQQNEIILDSGDVGTDNPTTDEGKIAPEGARLDAKILFISGTSESEAEGYYVDADGNVKDPKKAALHIRNLREFFNNASRFKNRGKLRAILVTFLNEKQYGLEGLTKMSYGATDEEVASDEFKKRVTDLDKGLVAQVFVEQDGDVLYYVDKDGNRIGEFGKQVPDVSNVVFQTMRTTNPYYDAEKKSPRFREGQKEEAEAYAAAWKKERAIIFGTDASVSPKIYKFQISRGLAKKGEDKNHLAGTVIPKEDEKSVLANQQGLVVIPTKGVVAHHTGEVKMPNGRPVLVYGDTLEFLDNVQFAGKRAEAIYQAINKIASEIAEQSAAGKRVVINKKLSRFLQNVLYWRTGDTTEGSNQINISEDGTSISFAGKKYSIPEVGSKKKEILEDIKKAYHNVNNKTLNAENFNKQFLEYYIDENGNLSETPRRWKNYQTYLLSSTYPDGSARSVADTPLSTKIRKPSAEVPNTHEQRYSTLIEMDLPVGVIVKPETPPTPPPAGKKERKFDYDGDTDNIVSTPYGDIIFTVKEGEDPKFDETDDTFIATRNKIVAALSDQYKKAGKEVPSEESLNAQANTVVVSLIKQELAKDVVIQEAPPTPPPPTSNVKKATTQFGDINYTVDNEGSPLVDSADAVNKVTIQKIRDAVKKMLPTASKEEIEEKVDGTLATLIQLNEDKAQAASETAPEDFYDEFAEEIEASRQQSIEEEQRQIEAQLAPTAPVSDKKAEIERQREKEIDRETPVKNENITVDFGGGVSVKYQVITYKDGSVKISTVSERPKRYSRLSDEAFKDYAKIDFESDAKGIIKTELVKDDYTDKQSQETKAAKEKTINAKYDAELAALEGAKPAAEAPKAPGSFNPKNIKSRGDRGFRKVGKLDRTDRMTDADLKAFKEWHAKNVPFIPFEVLEKMINVLGGKKAWGMFENGVAKFVRGGLRGTEYHEVFEGIWTMLSPEEQQGLIKEFRSKAGKFTDRESGRKYNYDDASVTDNMVKERIADDFSDYRLGKLPARSLGEAIRKFFKMIMDFFKSFVAKPSLKEDLFKAIDTGKFKEKTLSSEVMSMPPQYRAAGHLTEEQTNAYVQDMVALSRAILLGNTKEGVLDKSAIYNLRDLTGKEVFDKIEEIYTEQGIRQELGDVAWEDLVDKTKKQLKVLLKIEFNDADQVNINESETNRNDYAREPFSTDWKRSAPMGAKFVTATLIQREPVNNEDTASYKMPAPKEHPVYKTYSLVPYGRVFSTLINKLNNTTSVEKFIDKIVELANKDSNYVPLFLSLGGNPNTKQFDLKDFSLDDWRLFIEMYQTFTKQKPNALVQFVNKGQVYTASALQTDEVKNVTRSWIQNMRNLAKQGDSYIQFVDKKYSVTDDLKNLPTKYPEDKIAFLSELGVIFPMSTWQKLNEEQVKRFTDAFNSIKTYITSAKELMSVQEGTLDVAGPYNELAELLINATNPSQESTRANLDGKQTNSFADNNTISVFENEFNEVESIEELLELRPELNDVFSKGSLVLKLGGPFFDEDGTRTSKKLKVGYIEGTKIVDENRGVISSRQTLGSRFTQELNQNLIGEYYMLVPGDSTTEWLMNLGNHVAFEDVESGNDGWNATFEIFQNYLIDEVNLALDYKVREELRFVGGKAKELRFFKDILPEDIVTEIHRMVADDAPLSDIKEYIDSNLSKINNSVKSYLEATIDKTINNLIDNGEVVVRESKKDGTITYKYNMLNDLFAKKEGINKNDLTLDDIRNIVTFANINYTINNIEMLKLIFGDPYQFEVKKDGTLDATKRFKSFYSVRRTTFDHPEFNNKLNTELNKAGDIELTAPTDENPLGDIGYHEHKPYMNTSTLDDVYVVAATIVNNKNIPENVRKAFAKTDEANASSIIIDTAYREMKIKNRQWPKEAEEWFQWEMAYTRRYMPEYKYSDDARGKALEQQDIARTDKPRPRYTIEIVKPIVSGVKSGSNNINLVLDKFSQMPMFYSMVQGTNLESLYYKMKKEKKDYVIMVSGRKVGATELHSLYTPKGEFNQDPFNNDIEISWKSYGIQVETTYEGDKQQTKGSQITKIVTLDLFENGEPIGATPERKKVIADEVKRNNDLLDKLHENGYKRVLKRLGVEDLNGSYRIVDKRLLAKTLQDEMFRRELSDNVIDSVQLDENGEFIVPFEASSAYLQIKGILYSIVDKEITSMKVNGGGYVQAPVTLWEDSKKGRRIAIKEKDGYRTITRQEYDKLPKEQKDKVVLTDDTLEFYKDEDGKRRIEIMLPHWFRGRLGKHAKKSDAELIEFLNKTEEGRKILSGVGFRIPTQASSSIDVFVVKGFLPSYMGKTVVVPSAITTKTGSDFDIDKLNMYLKSIYIDESGEIRLVKLHGSEEETKAFYAKVFDKKLERQKINKAELLEAVDIFTYQLPDPKNLVDKYIDVIEPMMGEVQDASDVSETIMKKLEELGDKNLQDGLREMFSENMYRRALENEYYDSLEKLITLPENFQRLISPVSDDGLKDLAKELDGLRGYNENNIKARLIDRNYMTYVRHAFVVAKKWVGIVAVNITGHSLTQKFDAYIDPVRMRDIPKEDVDILKFNNMRVLLDHNNITVNGKQYISLSGTKDVEGNYISEGLSGYATSFVDVLKDPYIFKIISSDLTVGTFMFLKRIGVPKRQIVMFMNQPIIVEYLKMLDKYKVKDLYNDNYINEIFYKFPSQITDKDFKEFSIPSLENNIKEYYEKGSLDDYTNAEQLNILMEFLKYSKMSEYSFKLTQASNYDTTKFQSGDTLSLKQWRTIEAEKSNIISSVDKLLNSTFMGKQAEFLDKSMDAMGEVFVLEKPEFTNITDMVLKPYSNDQYLGKEKFDRIANKLKAAFLDYIIQTKSGLVNDLQKLLLDERDSVAQLLLEAKQKYPDVQIINELEIATSGVVGGAETIKLRTNDDIAYNENMYTGMMRELRDNPDTNALYKGIVKLSILQGTFRSPISIKNIIPVEDYAAEITPIISGLSATEELEAFATSYEFQRNEWQDNDIVPIVYPRFQEIYPHESVMLDENYIRSFRADIFKGFKRVYKGAFPNLEGLVKSGERQLLFLNAKYNAKVTKYDVIKAPRAVPVDKNDPTEGKIDMKNGKEITDKMYAIKQKVGDKSLNNYYGYQKVKYADGSPLIAEYDNEGNPVYVYKFINLHGDGMYATEYYGDGRPSVFNNGSEKNVKNVEGTIVSNEIPDQVIVDYYGGENVPTSEADVITSTIENETSVAPTQVAVSGVQNPQYKGLTEFNKLPGKSATPTMTYAGIGSRQTPEAVLKVMTEAAKYLDQQGFTLQTGFTFKNKETGLDEEGADKAFSDGAKNKILFGPSNIRRTVNGATTSESYNEEVSKISDAIVKELHPAPERLKPGAVKLMARNTNQIFGKDLKTTVDFVLFYAEEVPGSIRPKGGTGQAVEMARRKGIPTINMANPNWRQELDRVLSGATQALVSGVKPKIDLSKEWKGDLKTRPVYTAEGVNTMRTEVARSNEHFGNPWSEGGYGGTIVTKSENGIPAVTVAANNYKDWLLGNKFQNVKPEQRAWILDQINQGRLDGANLLYSKTLMDRGQGSHAISLAEVVEKLRGKQAVSAPETVYKDKAKRIRVEYPSTINVMDSTLNSSKLVEVSKLDQSDIFEAGILDYEKEVGNKYGPQAKRYAKITSGEISKAEGEFFKNNPEFGDKLLDAYESDELSYDKTISEYAQAILDQNERLVDTAQGRLFTSFDTTTEFTNNQKNKILANFGAKHKMNVEKAREYINYAMAEEPQKTIDKLKECYL